MQRICATSRMQSSLRLKGERLLEFCYVAGYQFPEDLNLPCNHLHLQIFNSAIIYPTHSIPKYYSKVWENISFCYLAKWSYFAVLLKISNLLSAKVQRTTYLPYHSTFPNLSINFDNTSLTNSLGFDDSSDFYNHSILYHHWVCFVFSRLSLDSYLTAFADNTDAAYCDGRIC